jgi:hypothetical protein
MNLGLIQAFEPDRTAAERKFEEIRNENLNLLSELEPRLRLQAEEVTELKTRMN